MRPSRLLPLALALACACAGHKTKPAEPAEPAVLTVEGWALAEGGEPASLRAKAVDDAHREAVSRALRAALSPAELSERAGELSAKVLAQSAKYALRERIVDEGRQGRYYKVRLEEALLFDRLVADLRVLGALSAGTKAPLALGLAVSGPAQAREELGRLFKGQGLEVVDLGSELPEAPELLVSSAAAAARERGLRLAVAGKAELRAVPGLEAGGFSTKEARLSLWIVDPQRGSVLSSSSQRATGGGPDEDIASGKALSAAAEAAAAEAAPALAKRLARPERLSLRILGLSGPEDLQTLMEWLRSRSETRDAAVEGWGGGAAQLSVGAAGLSSDELAALLLRQPGVRYDIRSVLPAGVELEKK